VIEYVAGVLMCFAGGALGGMLGVGGGVLFVPAIVLFFDEPLIRAEATSLLAIAPIAFVGAWRQYGYGNVRVRDGLLIGLLSPVGAAVGVVVANAVSQRALELAFAAMLLFFAVRLARRALTPEEHA
jgi:uncharacterized membrane protein YfcA